DHDDLLARRAAAEHLRLEPRLHEGERPSLVIEQLEQAFRAILYLGADLANETPILAVTSGDERLGELGIRGVQALDEVAGPSVPDDTRRRREAGIVANKRVVGRLRIAADVVIAREEDATTYVGAVVLNGRVETPTVL